VVARQALPPLRASLIRHSSAASRDRARRSSYLHLQNTTTAPFDQLTLADVQQYTQPISFGITTYELKQRLYTGYVQDSIHATDKPDHRRRLRYEPQTLTDAKHQLRAARRLRLAPNATRAWPSGRLRMYTRRSSPTSSLPH